MMTYKILLVEDEPDAMNLYANALTNDGMQVTKAVDGIVGLEAMEKEWFDLVVSGIIMPRMDGIEMMIIAKKDPDKYHNPRVVFLTNIAGDMAIEKAFEFGAEAYMIKSEITLEDLVRNVRVVVTK